MERGQPLGEMVERLTDPWAGKCYTQPLGQTLALVLMTLVSGANTERGIAAWSEAPHGRLKNVLGYRRNAVPSRSTIRRALQAMEGAELEQKLSRELEPRTLWASTAINTYSQWPGLQQTLCFEPPLAFMYVPALLR